VSSGDFLKKRIKTGEFIRIWGLAGSAGVIGWAVILGKPAFGFVENAALRSDACAAGLAAALADPGATANAWSKASGRRAIGIAADWKPLTRGSTPSRRF
jgi:hypothetical protein